MLLISICFVSFPILSQYLFRFPLYCFNETSLFVCTAILCFRHLSLISENSSWFDGTFLFMFLFSY
jgi:hypothetical protein